MEMSISGGSTLPAGPVLVTTPSLPDGHPYCTRSTNVLSIFQPSAPRQGSPADHEITEACSGVGRRVPGRVARAPGGGRPGSGGAPGSPTGSRMAAYLLFCCRTTGGEG